MNKKKQFIGLFSGTAVGDAIGLPQENLSPMSARRIFGKKIQPALVVIPLYKRFSTCSDDTEHLWLTAETLLETHTQNHDCFEYRLAQLLKRWVLTLPVGAGMATLKACFKLLLGIAPDQAGIFSAGNGPVMRAPVIGAFYADNRSKMEMVLSISTRMTHTDQKAYEGAWLIARAAAILINQSPAEAPAKVFFDEVLPFIQGDELRNYLGHAKKYLDQDRALSEYLVVLSLDKKGVSGYVNHTVPVIIYAWLRYFGDYRETIEQLIKAGGDTDTTAAIAGALAGITTGEEGIPETWLTGVYNSPLSIHKLRQLAVALANKDIASIPRVPFLFSLGRNILLFIIVILHGFRRIVPF